MVYLKLRAHSAVLHHVALVLVFSCDPRGYDDILDVLNLLLKTYDQRMLQSRFTTDPVANYKDKLVLGHH